MNRRKFLTLAGASALGAPFLIKQAAQQFAGVPPVANLARQPLSLALTPGEQKLFAALQPHARTVCLLGGGVVVKAQRRELPYANLLVESDDFAKIKIDLFRLGVEPVSTPELPSSIIRFGYGGTPYSVSNLPLDDYLRQNVLGTEFAPVPFAHNFLVGSLDGKWVIDPYGALENNLASKSAHSIHLLQTPASPVTGLTCALAATFDSSLFGLKESSACSRQTEDCLSQTVTADDTHLVMEQLINYVPDVLETCGFEAMQKFLLSPLCISAASTGAEIDLHRVNATLVATRRHGVEIDGARLLGALNKEFLSKPRLDGLGFGLSDYMATQGFLVRRTDLLATSLNLPDSPLAMA